MINEGCQCERLGPTVFMRILLHDLASDFEAATNTWRLLGATIGPAYVMMDSSDSKLIY